MSGLSLISVYGEDSEEEYDSSKGRDKVSKDIIECKRKKLPSPKLNNVPVVILEQHTDNPAEHGGRIRSFPHVRGNWATFVYIHYPDIQKISKLVDKLEAVISPIDNLCQKCVNVHISLSKTFVLKYHMISLFSKSLQEIFNNFESFELGFDSIAVYCNEEKTRTFVALKVDIFSQKSLKKLVGKVDTVLTEFKLPIFYEDPSFHMSVLDINGNKKAELIHILDKLNKIFSQEDSENKITTIINKVDCKSGNKNFQYYLD